jgi:hypothetical protein
MPASAICHKFFRQPLSHFNQARSKTLLDCADALIRSNRMTLTDIGRNLSGKAQVKHKIKRVDRFLGSDKLDGDKLTIYASLIHYLFSHLPYFVVAVDWSGCCGDDYHLSRASLLVDGRSIPLHNMVVTKADYVTRASHILFIDELVKILNTHKKVYIVTDGGYLTPWFQHVLKQGWHVVGRLRGTTKSRIGEGNWQSVHALHEGATSTPQYLGQAHVGKYTDTAGLFHLYLYKGEAKGRTGLSRFTKDQKTYARMAKEPWLLVSSDDSLSAKQVVTIYGKRMQIEQNFRDDKSQRYGFSWRLSKSVGVKRISALCLIAFIATLALWLIGFEGERRQLHHQFQANTTRDRRVLSFLTLAKQILKHYIRKVTHAYIASSKRYLIYHYDSYMLGRGI